MVRMRDFQSRDTGSIPVGGMYLLKKGGENKMLSVQEIGSVPPGNVFHHDDFNVGMSLRDVTLAERHNEIMLMSDGFTTGISFRVCDQVTGRRWRIVLERE